MESFRLAVYPGASREVLYFLHGRGQNHRSWSRWGPARDYYRSLAERGVPAPTVVSVSFGRVWLLTERGPHRLNGLLETFVREAMPRAEALTGPPSRRLLWGFSMGGFNAAQLVLRYPELWSAAVLSSAALPTVGPYPGRRELLDYRRRTGAGWLQVEFMRRAVRPYFRADGSWDRHDPFQLARRAERLPPIYIECSDRDHYGFLEGSRRLYEELLGAGHTASFEACEGQGHCWIPVRRVAEFLSSSGRESLRD